MSTLAEYLYGLRYNRHLYKFQLAQAKARIEGAERAEAQFQQDLASHRPNAIQRYAARGLGDSSIQQQGMSDFDASAARREAALQSNISLSKQGLSLLKEHHRMQERLKVFEAVKATLNSISMVSGLLGGSSSPNAMEQQGEPWAQGPTEPQSSYGWGDDMNRMNQMNDQPNLRENMNTSGYGGGFGGGISGQDAPADYWTD